VILLQEVNVRGHYLVLQNYIKSQGDKPTGTLIVVSSGMAGVVAPGSSAYAIGKLAQERLTEYADTEYPSLRVFTLHPGIVSTDLTDPDFEPFALDEVELAGHLSLYLAQPRADYLRGSFVSVNWDVTEMEAHKEEIAEKKLLKMSWLPVLPVGGGKGLA
jgi:NAD(P)-dependent dehydrogenase (short-subunit alcohol dehydrogenase family)